MILDFEQGLGDAVQFTIVLNHLRRTLPDHRVHVLASPGQEAVFAGLCERVLTRGVDRPDISTYDVAKRIRWVGSNYVTVPGCPSTKPAMCLMVEFEMWPIEELFNYTIQCSRLADEAVSRWLRSLFKDQPLSRYRAAIIHYSGDTSRNKKDISPAVVISLCREMLRLNILPIIVDWEERWTAGDGHGVILTRRNPLWAVTESSVALLYALIQRVALVVGIDSGPLHLAGASSTPAIGVWTEHHPVHYFDLAPNVVHLVPADHRRHAGQDGAIGYFESKYRYREYYDLTESLIDEVRQQCDQCM